MNGEIPRYDVAVIGGGITGAATARDAALRGYRTALFEKGDFGSGTSSKTTRLIHGGLRYLEYGDLPLVRESLRERELLHRQAPHLLRPLPVLLPSYRGGGRGLGLVAAGMFLYDVMSPAKALPHCTVLGRKSTLAAAPSLRAGGLKGAGLFYDYQMAIPERFVTENVRAARRAGAECRNHTAVTGVAEAGDGFALDLLDDEGKRFRVGARAVVNAGGAWADRIGALYRPNLPRRVFATKGAHLVLRGATGHAVFTSAADGRLVFTIPLGNLTLVGATDTAYEGDLDLPAADGADSAYLLDAVARRGGGAPPTAADVLWTYAGVRPLLSTDGTKKESAVSRRHAIHRDGPGGRFVTVVGGKFTTFRKMAEDAVDAVGAALGERRLCPTAETPLFAGEGADFPASLPLPPEDRARLRALYGPRAAEVAAADSESLLRPLAPGCPALGLEVLHAVREEDARHLDDLLLRRLATSVSADRGLSGLDGAAGLMAAELGWDRARTAGEKERFRRAAGLGPAVG